MKNTDLQQIYVFANERHKFIHVGIFNMFDKEGRPNYSAKLDYLYNDAKRCAQMDEYRESVGAETSFGGSFTVRLMNTAREDWNEKKHITNLELFNAQELAEELRDFYEAEGYDVTGLRGQKIARRDGTSGKYVNNIIIKDATLKRIYQIVDRLTDGMAGIDIAAARRDIYKKYTSMTESNFNTRRKFWHHIMKNWETYSL